MSERERYQRERDGERSDQAATIIGADIDKMSQREQIIDELAKTKEQSVAGPERERDETTPSI